jgi:hypothetical protein
MLGVVARGRNNQRNDRRNNQRRKIASSAPAVTPTGEAL